jgi:DNA (cytosine-5)-methyltransferase 1
VRAVDLFAGAGGWDIAARRLGIETYGIEIDADAYATQVAAGHVAFLGDVRAAGDTIKDDFALIMDGLIASPPCQTFSAAGKGAGRKNLDLVLGWAYALAEGVELDYSQFEDERTGLVLEPLRWILDAYERAQPYEWIALEQVPAVLPVWEAYSDILLTLGYSTDVGLLHAEQYGVPQTRKRAILVAKHTTRKGLASLPTPTYSRYHSRTPDKVDSGTEKWISMAEWLGWDGGDRIGFPRRDDGLDTVDIDGTAYRARDFREAALPAFNLTEKARSWTRMVSVKGEGMLARAGQQQSKRTLDQPSLTVTGAQGGGSERLRWVSERPATTVQSTDRIGRPGHKCMTLDCHPGRGTNAQFDGSIRVSLEEAAALQTFPPGYPFQGTKTSKFRQIGNAIPPVLAHAILAELIKE